MASLRVRNTSLLTAAFLAAAVLSPAALAQADAPLPNPPPFPEENPLLPDQDKLGKVLFWEEQLSQDNTMACGTCHIHEFGGSDPRVTTNPGADGMFGTDDDVRGSAGVVQHDLSGNFVHEPTFFPDAQVTGRRSPSPINAAYFNNIFWDGRATGAYTDPQTGLVEIAYLGALESQAAGPPVSSVEMSPLAQTWDDIAAKLQTVKPLKLATNIPADMADFVADNPTYEAMFEAVYGPPEEGGGAVITSKRIMFAIANYERTLISDETLVDDFLKGTIPDFEEPNAPAGVQEGFNLFQGSANCATCHTLPLTTDNDFHNIGVRPDFEDHGREDFTGNPADRAKFKTPAIRNSRLRVPLFHNGSAATLEEVVEFYDIGGEFDTEGNLDPNIIPLNLTQQEKDDLVTFLDVGMTDARVENGIFPFTRPTLRSELPPTNTLIGVASQSGSGEFPEVIRHVPANLGHARFALGATNAVPSSAAILVFAFQGDPAGTPFPDPRFPVPMNVDLPTIFFVASLATDADGTVSFNLPIPPSPALANVKIYAQWLFDDPTALATGGVYGSQGVEILMF